MLGTWRRKVDRFIAVSDFTRDRYLAAGFDADRIAVKPNIVEGRPSPGDGSAGFALFAGRLSEEKGLATVLQAWRATPSNPRLLIVGDGPLRVLQNDCEGDERIEFLGHCGRERLYELMGQARFFIAASEWFETFGMTIIEAFACGTPVIAARIGAYQDLVEEANTGFFFEPGDAASLQRAIDKLQDISSSARMRQAARHSFEHSFSEQQNYELLTAVYEKARRNLANGAAHSGLSLAS
jgi:glycosyltransferase involved in cell wall biosynthesis